MDRNRGKASPVLLLCLFLLWLACGFSPAASAEEGAPEIPAPAEKGIQDKIDDLQRQAAAFSENLTEENARALGVSLEKLRERPELIREEIAYLNRHLLAWKKIELLEQEKKLLRQKVQSGEAFVVAEPPPYSLNFYDQQADALAEADRTRQAAEMTLALAVKSLESARARAGEAAQNTRQLRDELRDASPLRQFAWEDARRRESLAAAIVAFQEAAVAIRRAELELAADRFSIADRLLAQVRKKTGADEAGLQEEIGAVDRKLKEVAEGFERAQLQLQKYENEIVVLQKRLDRSSSEEETALAGAAVAAADMWRQNWQKRLEQYEVSQQLLAQRKQLWERRYELLRRPVAHARLSEWRKDTVFQLDRLQQWLSLQQTYQANLLPQAGKLDEQLGREEMAPEMIRLLKEQKQAVKNLAEATGGHAAMLSATTQLYTRFLDEITRRQQNVSVLETARAAGAVLVSVWKIELFALEEHSITIGKVTIALLILVVGIVAAGRITRSLQRRLIARANMSRSVAATVEKLVRYLLVLAVILFAMRIVSIPLTAFTFLGGALAIGVGFGAQKLISNFISGFILMAEQPVKVGDLVQLGEDLGWIDDIGVRSTRVRTFANINILVPNSYFLENIITNWTHNDAMVRGKVTIGVMYGSSTQEVKRLLLRAAAEHGGVLGTPEPYVFFSDFGDNALVFTLYFWVTISPEMGSQRIESDLRFRIDDLFRAANIVVAFPQRDIHMDASQPLRIELVRHRGGERA